MQDFRSTLNRTLNLPNVTPYNRNNSRTISPSDKSHTITQISRCILILQIRIDKLSEIVGEFGYKSRELEAERLLEVELCAMENVWGDVRGRLVGSRAVWVVVK